MQVSNAILTYVGVVTVLGYEHREDALSGGRSRQWQTHKHTHSQTHTHCVPVIHRVDGASGNDRKLFDNGGRGTSLMKSMGY